jgi:hypothetical protein
MSDDPRLRHLLARFREGITPDPRAVFAILLVFALLSSGDGRHVKRALQPYDDTADTEFWGPRPPRQAYVVARAIYRYSIIRGGAYSIEEFENAASSDRVVAAHYANFQRRSMRVETNSADRLAYVSYRVGDAVYWTKNRVRIPAQEEILTDGVHEARARCGNQISMTPQGPILPPAPEPGQPPSGSGTGLHEPGADDFDVPDASTERMLSPTRSGTGGAPGPMVPNIFPGADLGSLSSANAPGGGGGGAGFASASAPFGVVGRGLPPPELAGLPGNPDNPGTPGNNPGGPDPIGVPTFLTGLPPGSSPPGGTPPGTPGLPGEPAPPSSGPPPGNPPFYNPPGGPPGIPPTFPRGGPPPDGPQTPNPPNPPGSPPEPPPSTPTNFTFIVNTPEPDGTVLMLTGLLLLAAARFGLRRRRTGV